MCCCLQSCAFASHFSPSSLPSGRTAISCWMKALERYSVPRGGVPKKAFSSTTCILTNRAGQTSGPFGVCALWGFRLVVAMPSCFQPLGVKTCFVVLSQEEAWHIMDWMTWAWKSFEFLALHNPSRGRHSRFLGWHKRFLTKHVQTSEGKIGYRAGPPSGYGAGTYMLEPAGPLVYLSIHQEYFIVILFGACA